MTGWRGPLLWSAAAAATLPFAACGLFFPTVLEDKSDAGGDASHGDSAAGDDATAPSDAGSNGEAQVSPDAGDSATIAVNDAGADAASSADADAGLDAGSACDADFDADPTNCGWCGHNCRGGACTGGFCAQQIAFYRDTNLMAIDHGAPGVIYFVQPSSSSDAGTFAVDLSSSFVMPLVPSGQKQPQFLVAQGSNLLWGTSDGTVRRSHEDGGPPVTLGTGYSLDCMAANSTDSYWWDYITGNVYRAPVAGDGGAPAVYYSTSGSTGGCIAADDTTVVMLTPGGLVERDLDAGTTSTVVLPVVPDHHHLALAGQDVYWLANAPNDAGAQVLQLAHTVLGSTAVQMSAAGYITFPTQLAATNGGVFWAENPDVFGCTDPRCSSGVHHYSATTPFGSGIVADSTWIYVSSVGAGRIFKFAQ